MAKVKSTSFYMTREEESINKNHYSVILITSYLVLGMVLGIAINMIVLLVMG